MPLFNLKVSKLDSTFMTVTPAMAKDILEKYNTINRNGSKTHQKRLAAMMARGEWMENGDPIRFAKTGRLLDGQNRLNAIILSRTSQKMLVVRGLDENVFVTIDEGMKRVGKHVLEVVNAKNPGVLACALQMVEQYYRTSELGGSGSVRRGNKFVIQAWNTCDKEHMNKCVTIAIRAHRRFKSKGLLAAVGYLLGPGLLPTYEKFVLDLTSDAQIGKSKAALAFLAEMESWGTKTVNNRELAALLVKTINAAVQGKGAPRLVWTRDDEFPRLVGTYTTKPEISEASA